MYLPGKFFYLVMPLALLGWACAFWVSQGGGAIALGCGVVLVLLAMILGDG